MIRKFIAGAVGTVTVGGMMAVSGAVFAGPAFAAQNEGASPTCSALATEVGPSDIYVTIPSSPGAAGSDQVCIENPASPITGTVTASGSATSTSGYVVADGNSTDPGASAGYLGVAGSSSGASIVGCSSGNYDPNESAGDSTASTENDSNNTVFSTTNPTPPATSGPCAVPTPVPVP
ncbi:MAG: hypothetical protein ACYCS7_07015 [Acidimicrobiales bacterium]